MSVHLTLSRKLRSCWISSVSRGLFGRIRDAAIMATLVRVAIWDDKTYENIFDWRRFSKTSDGDLELRRRI